MSALRPAVFLDRDGTIIHDARYISRPEQVRLLPGVAGAIARLNRRDIPVIIVSNQSGIARGYYTLADYKRVQARMEQLLAEAGAQIDAIYICAHHPSAGDTCECRKPGTLLFRCAIAEHALEPSRCWYVGDRWRDVAPAEALGGHALLVPAPDTPPDERARAAERGMVADTLSFAVDRILTSL